MEDAHQPKDSLRDETRRRVLLAWQQFADHCSGTIAPEATYQAWFAHFLIEQFGLRKVVREVDFGARHLLHDDQLAFTGDNLRLDVCVLRNGSAVSQETTDPVSARGWEQFHAAATPSAHHS